MARKNPMAITCPECGGNNVRMSKWKNFFEKILDLFGMPPMRCLDCDYRWKHSLWRLRETLNARCPRCYRLELVNWEETYYHIPKSWKIMLAFGAKKVRCKPCRHNFVSFRFVRGKRKWENVDLSETPVVETTIDLRSVENLSSQETKQK
jgi:C4-type Zn-finger protein